MATLHLILLVGWLTLIGLVRSAIHYRRTGNLSFRVTYEIGTPQFWALTLSLIGVAGLFGAPLAAKMGLDPIDWLDRVLVRDLGVALAVVGVLASVWGQTAMGDSWRVDVDPEAKSQLVLGGPFEFVRNPIFTGTTTTTIGLAAVLPNLVSVMTVLVLVLALEIQIRLVEEPYLIGVHGESYLAYARRVGRFVPGMGRLGSLRVS